MKFALVALIAVFVSSVSAIRYMPLGDSITTLCWRALLYRKLQAAGFNMNQIDFVGTQTATMSGTPCSGSAFDQDHEGHSGYQAVNIASQNMLPGWLSQAKPDIITMHLGTNDQWNNRQTDEIINAFTTMIKQMRASNPNMYIIVAQIIPERNYDAGVAALNSRIPSWAAGLSTAQSPIVVVDQNTGFSISTDSSDGVHPNDNGNEKIASKWLPAFVTGLAKLGVYPQGTSPSPSARTSPSPSLSPRTSPSPSSSPSPSPKTSPISSPITSPTTCGSPVGLYGQCGGQYYTGSTCCASGSTCKFVSNFYSQCVQDTSSSNCQPQSAQCGGQTYTGTTCCASGSTCVFVNQWYSQCRA